MADPTLPEQARAALREGDIQGADTLLTQHMVEAGAPGAVEPPPEPTVEEALQDLLAAIVAHLGNHPALGALLLRLVAALEKKAS